MATSLRMQVQTTPGGSFTDVDFEAKAIAGMGFIAGYSHPAVLRWVHHLPQHTFPLGIGNFVRFWDPTGTDPDGNTFSESNPLFEGFLRSVDPGDEANLVICTAHDPTQLCGQDITIMSTGWILDGADIVEGTGAVPRLVYNVYNDNDPDYAWERGHNGTIGQIYAGLLEDAILPLRYYNAAPSTGNAYEGSDLSQFTMVPQDKIVFEAEGLTEGILRILSQWEPEFRMQFIPGVRKWRVRKLTAAPAITLTLNEKADHPVLALRLDRSFEDRATAVKIYGPEATNLHTFDTDDGSLSYYGSPVVLETYSDFSGTGNQVLSYREFQITDEDLRRGARRLPQPVLIPVVVPGSTFGFLLQTWSPTLQYSYDDGVSWATHWGTRWDFKNGIASIGDTDVAVHVDPPPVTGSSQQWFVPNRWKLVWASYVEPLTVRSPSSGFSGTAYTVGNFQITKRRYEENLAIGREYGVPVTAAFRVAQYQELADTELRQRQDVVYTGTVVLDGIDYRFSRLYTRLNFAGKDGDGTTISTGLEAAGAIVTDVEYDYEEDLTIVTFSSDQYELMGYSVELLRRRLRIKALQQRVRWRTYNWYRPYVTYFGNVVRDWAGSALIGEFYYQDPDSGQVMT